ncbi:hypothetical protein [Streptomyces sp. NPDC037389]|uniref:nSTAND1 domain-containing NTPase n=1 Tax=Streptomyces sp. NPDC037389 TaxID=3155369 RepID=UPI0033D00954
MAPVDLREPLDWPALLSLTLPGILDTSVTAAVVIGTLTQGRLLTRERDSVGITHEVLPHAWPRLRDWIEADWPGNLIRQGLERTAYAWDHAQRVAFRDLLWSAGVRFRVLHGRGLNMFCGPGRVAVSAGRIDGCCPAAGSDS